MSYLSKRLHSLFAPRTVDVESTVIFWWGIFPWGATVGDCYAVKNLSDELTRRGHRHSIISHPDYGFEGHIPVTDLSTIKRNIRTLVFVCGPLTENDKLSLFMSEHRRARKIAVGVSVLKNHDRMNRRFDHILARDGQAVDYFDLAITEVVPPSGPLSQDRLKIGICLRGKQKDYGNGVARFEKAEQALRGAAAQFDAETVEIDTVIRHTNRLDDIVAKFSAVDVLLTTRLHGSLFALAAGKPVIAVDQIPGGAKVKAALNQIEWPHVFAVDSVSEELVVAKLRELIERYPEESIRHSQGRIMELGRHTLDTAADLIVSGGR